MKNISISNHIIRAKVHPALKAMQAILSIVSSDYHKITFASLSKYLKEKRTATETKIKELASVQFQQNRSGFTLVLDEVLLSNELSLASKGLYMMVISFATFPGFVITKDYFYKISAMTFKTFDKAWKELIKADLLQMQQHRTYNGQFIYTYTLAEFVGSQQEFAEDLTDVSPAEKITTTEITAIATLARKHRLAHCNLKRNSQAPARSSWAYHQDQRHRNIGNFEQREYDDDFLNSFFVDLTASGSC